VQNYPFCFVYIMRLIITFTIILYFSFFKNINFVFRVLIHKTLPFSFQKNNFLPSFKTKKFLIKSLKKKVRCSLSSKNKKNVRSRKRKLARHRHLERYVFFLRWCRSWTSLISEHIWFICYAFAKAEDEK
jgi:hypothetical protein